MEDERPVMILVHPLLKLELQKRKEIMEEEIGYVVHGGIPIVSKIAASELKKCREEKANVREILLLQQKYKDEGKISLLIHPEFKRELAQRFAQTLQEDIKKDSTRVSFDAAKELQLIREKKLMISINVEVHKKKGVKRVEMIKLW